MREHPKKETDDYGEQAAKQVSSVYGKVRQTYLLLGEILRVAQVTVMGIPVIGQALRGFGQLWQIALSSMGLIKKEGKWTRGIKTTVGLTTLGLLIGTIAAPATAAILGVAAIGLGYSQELWILTAAFISRATGSWKKEREALAQQENDFYNLLSKNPQSIKTLTQERRISNKINTIKTEISMLEQKIQHDKNGNEQLVKQLHGKKTELISLEKEKKEFISSLSEQQKNILSIDNDITSQRNALRSRDGELAGKSFNFLVGGLALAGAVMLITPLAPVGAAILLATSIYGLLVTFDPFGWTNKVKNLFFGPKTETIEKVNQEVAIRTEKNLELKGPAVSISKSIDNGAAPIFQKLAGKDSQSALSMIKIQVADFEKTNLDKKLGPIENNLPLATPEPKEKQVEEQQNQKASLRKSMNR